MRREFKLRIGLLDSVKVHIFGLIVLYIIELLKKELFILQNMERNYCREELLTSGVGLTKVYG